MGPGAICSDFPLPLQIPASIRTIGVTLLPQSFNRAQETLPGSRPEQLPSGTIVPCRDGWETFRRLLKYPMQAPQVRVASTIIRSYRRDPILVSDIAVTWAGTLTLRTPESRKPGTRPGFQVILDDGQADLRNPYRPCRPCHPCRHRHHRGCGLRPSSALRRPSLPW